MDSKESKGSARGSGGRGEGARDLGDRGPGRRTLRRPLGSHATQNLKVNGCYA